MTFQQFCFNQYFVGVPIYEISNFQPIYDLNIQNKVIQNGISASESDLKSKSSINLPLSREDLMKAGYNQNNTLWNYKEDKKLLKLAKLKKKNWDEVAKAMRNRNPKMCYSRFRRLNDSTRVHWTQKEERLILTYVENLGQDWKNISKLLKNGTAKQIKYHYEYYLKPKTNKSYWTVEQDLLLIELLKNYGNDWKNIQKQMEGRNESQIKNRYFNRLLKIFKNKQSSQQIGVQN